MFEFLNYKFGMNLDTHSISDGSTATVTRNEKETLIVCPIAEAVKDSLLVTLTPEQTGYISVNVAGVYNEEYCKLLGLKNDAAHIDIKWKIPFQHDISNCTIHCSYSHSCVQIKITHSENKSVKINVT